MFIKGTIYSVFYVKRENTFMETLRFLCYYFFYVIIWSTII